MEITGKIITACEPRGGVSQRTGNSWKMQEFVIETAEQYPRKCMFSVFGEDRLKEFNIQVGEILTVSVVMSAFFSLNRIVASLSSFIRMFLASAAGFLGRIKVPLELDCDW